MSLWRRWALPAVTAIAIVEAAAVVSLIVTRPRQVPAAQPQQAAAASAVPSLAPAPPPSPAAAPARSVGRLQISSDAPGARVSVDGTARGVTPLLLELDPGSHTVVVADRERTVTQTVAVAAGGSSTLVAAMGSAGLAAGWLTVNSPIELQILEGGSLVGTTSASRVLLPAGLHNLVLANSAFGFQTTLSADVKLGKTTALTVAVPNGSLSLNALPWANVWVDGRAMGSTPVANIDLAIGNHEVIWRHPQLGERRQTAAVTAKAPLRLVMDFNK
jgi:hypothetical protein